MRERTFIIQLGAAPVKPLVFLITLFAVAGTSLQAEAKDTYDVVTVGQVTEASPDGLQDNCLDSLHYLNGQDLGPVRLSRI